MGSWERALLLSRYALEKKAYDLVLIEVSEVTSIADYFIICSGRSDRQVQSIAQGLQENLGKMGISSRSIEGLNRGHWVLMDFSDVIVHVFRHRSGTYFFFTRITDIAISASEIRNRVRGGKSIHYLVPQEVETYIKKKGLYRGRQEERPQD